MLKENPRSSVAPTWWRSGLTYLWFLYWGSPEEWSVEGC